MANCERCYGYGWYPIGTLVPIGKMDSNQWDKMVIKCPWCGAGFVDEGDRYDALKRVKEETAGKK